MATRRAASAKRKTRARKAAGPMASVLPFDPNAAPTRPDETRVASKGQRRTFTNFSNRLTNDDPTLVSFGGFRGIQLFSDIIRQNTAVAGHFAQWVDNVLRTPRSIKPAKADPDAPDTEARQALADAAAMRAAKAWNRARTQIIAMQRLLWMRWYGFYRVEKVARFDRVVKEWIPEMYDTPVEAWRFDDQGKAYLVKDNLNRDGVLVDDSKFIHAQWGSVDTRYGRGIAGECYLPIWKIQRIEEFGLQAVEDYSRLIAIVHMPRSFVGSDRQNTIDAIAEQYRYYVVVPSDEMQLRVEVPTLNVTANAGAGRQEYEVCRFYERWLQIRILGAPQTQDKGGAGNGKLDEVRSGQWDSKLPIGSAMLDRILTEGWMDTYCDWNMADLDVELRPRFESDSVEITAGLSEGQAKTALEVGRDLVAKKMARDYAEEMLASVGIPRPRAKAMVEASVKDRDSLVVTMPVIPTLPQQPNNDDAEEEGEADDAASD